jgi:hypothetical protein
MTSCVFARRSGSRQAFEAGRRGGCPYRGYPGCPLQKSDDPFELCNFLVIRIFLGVRSMGSGI